METLKIYTDGSCKNNGKTNAKASYAVFFSKSDHRNICELLSGEQTNNRAELSAIYKALQILYNDQTSKYKNIIIFTDSLYSLNSITIWSVLWKENNWKTKNKKDVKNKDLIQDILSYIKLFPNIKLQYIKAHTNLLDEDSLGNQQADLLANSIL